MPGTMRVTGNISVKERHKTPYLTEFIKGSHNKCKTANVSAMKKRYKALQGLVQRFST